MYFIIGFVTLTLLSVHAMAEGEEKMIEMATPAMKHLCDDKGTLVEDKYKKLTECLVIILINF